MSAVPTVGVLGLGEAGSVLARELAATGVRVRGWDPQPPRAGDAEGVEVVASAAEAVRGTDVVLSVNSAAVAVRAATTVVPQLRAEQLYADLNTAAPALKREVAAVVAPTRALFVDVALLDAVTRHGLRTPALASGPGAGRFAAFFASRGMPVTVLSAEPGEAAGRKLVRSVFAKGVAAAIDEALTAAERLGCAPWLRADIERTLTAADAALVERFLVGSRLHAVRRTEEMTAARELLAGLGVEPRVAAAAEAWLRDLARTGLTRAADRASVASTDMGGDE